MVGRLFGGFWRSCRVRVPVGLRDGVKALPKKTQTKNTLFEQATHFCDPMELPIDRFGRPLC